MKDNLSNEKENSDYKVTNLYNKCKIIRDKYTKSAYVEINFTGEWSLFAGDSINSIDLHTTIAQGKNPGKYPIHVSPSKRSYFKVVTSMGSAILAETQLPMEGGYNFRDMGGLETNNGKHIRWGKIFRSDDLYNLSNKDLHYLSSIPITTIVDFRCKEEYSMLPDRFPQSLKKCYKLSIDPGSLQAFAKSKFTSKDEVINAMKNLYKLLVTKTEYINAYKEYFSLLQNQNELPLLFHCSAGKDRTGFAAALFLFALDIPKENILEDYMASNTYLSNKYHSLLEENPTNKYLYTIMPEYLETALETINEKYGSIINFLESKMQIDIEMLKNNFLF